MLCMILLFCVCVNCVFTHGLLLFLSIRDELIVKLRADVHSDAGQIFCPIINISLATDMPIVFANVCQKDWYWMLNQRICAYPTANVVAAVCMQQSESITNFPERTKKHTVSYYIIYCRPFLFQIPQTSVELSAYKNVNHRDGLGPGQIFQVTI